MENTEKVKVGMISLGCAKTLVDSEVALGFLKESNYEIVPTVQDADVAIVNTCAFIGAAREESVEKVVELIGLKEEGVIKKVVVMGCLPQKYYQDLKDELSEVDAFVGTGDYPEIAKILKEVQEGKKVVAVGSPQFLYDMESPRFSLTPSYYRYVKISEGCNHKCSFCIIPQLKGLHRSREIPDVIKEVEQHGKEGVQEVILTGQDTTFYGKDFANKFVLPDLLRDLNKVEAIKWIRLLYAYPVHLSDHILKAIADSEKVCNYIDVPLQHISDNMLNTMNRHVDSKFTKKLVNRIRTIIPEVAIRTTFIVGFPGETDDDFNQLMEFIAEAQFERLGVFQYSFEEFSESSKLPNQLPEEVKEERFNKLMSLQRDISKKMNEQWIDKTCEVLIEGESTVKNTYIGRTYRDAPDVDGQFFVTAPEGVKLKTGQFVQSKIKSSKEYDLYGDMITSGMNS